MVSQRVGVWSSHTVSVIGTVSSSVAANDGVAVVAPVSRPAGVHEYEAIVPPGTDDPVPSSVTVLPSCTAYGPPGAASGNAEPPPTPVNANTNVFGVPRVGPSTVLG